MYFMKIPWSCQNMTSMLNKLDNRVALAGHAPDPFTVIHTGDAEFKDDFAPPVLLYVD